MSTHTFFEFHKMPVCILSCCCRAFVEFSSRWKSLYSSSKWESWKTTRDLLQCHPSILNNTKHMHSEKNYKFIIIINFVEDCIPFRGNRFIRGNLLLWLKIDHFTKNVIIHTSTYCIDKKCIEWFHETWKIFYQIFNCKVCSTASIQVAFLFKKGEELIGKVVVCYA